MHREFSSIIASAMLCMFAQSVIADDNQNNNDEQENDIHVRVQGPVETVDCKSTPPTVKILGLTIDISSLTGSSGSRQNDGSNNQNGTDEKDGDNNNQHGPDGNNNDDHGGGNGGNGGTTTAMTCPFTAGQIAMLKLNGDKPPLVANDGSVKGGYDSDIFVQGPIQAIDLKAQSITILGLTIGMLTSNGNTAPAPVVDLSTLMIGEGVTVFLQSATPPLTAKAIVVHHEDAGLVVELSGDNNNHDDGEIDIEETIVVTTPPPPGTTASKHSATVQKSKGTKKQVHFHATIHNGHAVLKGLPAGKANLMVRRNGKLVASKKLNVRQHQSQKVRLKLRKR